MPPPKPKAAAPAAPAPAPAAAAPAAPAFDAFGEFASAPPPSPPIFSPSLGSPPRPAPLSVNLFDPEPWGGVARPAQPRLPPNLLDAPSPPPTPLMTDPYGLTDAATTPGPLHTMSPLEAALPSAYTSPLPTPAKAKLGEASKKSSDPFANLMDL